jgi:hypothetical protein
LLLLTASVKSAAANRGAGMGQPTAHRAGTSVLLLLLSVAFSAHPATAQVVGCSIGVNISGDLQRALPLSALRTWADALTLVPGVTTSQARFQTYSLFGTAHPSGVALIDGADATSVLQGSTLYSQFGRDTFSDIQAKTGGVDASTPLGLGAVLIAASQTVTDRFSGAAAYQYEPKDWNADNTPGGQSLTVTTRQAEFSLGRPIVRGDAWFFGTARIALNATGNRNRRSRRRISARCSRATRRSTTTGTTRSRSSKRRGGRRRGREVV